MRIYLLRHGIAEDAGPRTPDAKRELTDKGREKLASVLRLAKRAGIQPEVVMSSSLLRAVQTAEMAREILEVKAALRKTDALAPEESPQRVWEELSGLRKLDEVMLAGHQPQMGHLVAYLLGTPTLQVHLTKAALVAIEMEHLRGQPEGTLEWMITPKLGE
jgi:phosphohistidine phosphatase